MSGLRWGIIGPGRIANQFASALNATESTLQAVHSSNLERAKQFAKTYNAPIAVDRLEDLLNRDDVDVIYIANPHRFHLDSVKAVIAAGKPVLCEKPLTVTAEQSQSLVDLATEQNVFLMEALWSRFLPCWQQVRRWIESGEIGEIKHLTSSFGFAIPRDSDDRLLNIELAGGVLLDMGVYNVAMSQFVMQANPVSITSDVFVGETGVDERTSVLLNYGAVTSQFTAAFTTLLDNSFHIHGSTGVIKVPSMFWAGHVAELHPFESEATVFDEPLLENGFEYQIMEVERCLAAGKLQSDTISWADTLATQKVMDTILEQGGVRYPFA